MIPKTIHYCWLSKDPLPTEAQECIKSWKKYMPNWKLKLWNMDNFDVNSVPFVADAVKARKWAFAADYIRIYAIYNEGGVYLDSDVLVRKNMDFVLENRAFSAIECFPHLLDEIKAKGLVDNEGEKVDPSSKIHGLQIQAAILGGEKGHPFFKDCLDYYNAAKFTTDENGVPSEDMISPIVMAGIAEKYGFKYLDKEQMLDEGFKLYSRQIFVPQPYLMDSFAVAVHCCNGSWRDVHKPVKHFISNLKIRVKRVLNALGLHKEKAIDKIK